MKKPKRDWTAIEAQATAAAARLGHELTQFAHPRQCSSVRTASCNICGGCCWVAYTPTRGVSAGGRLLKYRCGDPQAAGFANREAVKQ